jgi:hypothetical protein
MRFVLLAVILALLGAGQMVEAQEKVKGPTGPAPRFFTVTEVAKNHIELTELTPTEEVGEFKSASYRPAPEDLRISDAAGKRLTAQEFRKRAKEGTVVVVSSNAEDVDSAYLRVLSKDTIVLVGVIVRSAGPAPPK